jgi:hypothetical protein
MPLPRFGLCLCFALAGVVATAAPLRAEPRAVAAAEPVASQAVVVLVGAAGRDPELQALLRELLERRGVHTRISEQNGFGREELLRAATPASGVFVFIVPELAGNVGLYFRAPDGERFLLRNVLLRAGFDDVGRELVGQVVETAVASLLHTGDGLTREQAQLALSSDQPTSAPLAKANRVEVPAGTVARAARKPAVAPSPPRPSTILEGWFALRYGAVALGTELGVAHGPGLELGLGVKRHLLLRSRLTFERDFPQSFETSRIAAKLTRLRLRVTADAGLPLTGEQLLLVSLGIGQDRLDVKPTAPAGSSVAPAAAFQDQAPVAHGELRYEASLARFRLAVALGADASLVETHYDLAHPTERERVVRPWLVRPSASLALAFCPRWATF